MGLFESHGEPSAASRDPTGSDSGVTSCLERADYRGEERDRETRSQRQVQAKGQL